MKIDVLISTLNDGIRSASNICLEPRDDVQYIIIHQYTDESYLTIPKKLQRKDVRIYHFPERGICKSRNKALSLAESDIAIIADDDVKYNPEYFNKIKEYYEANKDMSVGCFMIKTPPGEPSYKQYPSKMQDLRKQLVSISSIEVTFRPAVINKNCIRFDELFGLGSGLAGGEEVLFINDCLKKNLGVFFIPEYIVEHPYESTIKKAPKYHSSRNKVVGAIDFRLNGKMAFLNSFYYTFRFSPQLLKNKKNPFSYLKERVSGCFYIYNNSRGMHK